MTTIDGTDRTPLWLAIEEQIQALGAADFSEAGQETAVQRLASSLDQAGYAVSGNAGHMMDVRRAVRARASVGRAMMEDLNQAFDALTLEKVASPYAAAAGLIDEVGKEWPQLKSSDRRPHILEIVERIKLDLLVAKAKDQGGEGGIRLLIGEEVAPDTIIERMETTREEYDRVLALVEAERAERARVTGLLEDVGDKADDERIRHLITKDVAEELIVEMAGVDQAAIDAVKQAMEEEIREKERLAAEAAAKKAAEAAGPSLEDIPPDEMLEYIDSIREILDFSDVEKEIRVMCEQSGIPKDLVEIAVSDPDRLDELEAEAEG
jgi:hypothetical protein